MSNNENSLVQAIREGASNSFAQTGSQVVGRSMTIQPTLTVRPGFPVRVIVTRDLVLNLTQAEDNAMANLKLGAIEDEKPVKLTVELPATVHRDLVAYAKVLGRVGGPPVAPARLIAPMLGRSTATDREFAKRRGLLLCPGQAPSQAEKAPEGGLSLAGDQIALKGTSSPSSGTNVTCG